MACFVGDSRHITWLKRPAARGSALIVFKAACSNRNIRTKIRSHNLNLVKPFSWIITGLSGFNDGVEVNFATVDDGTVGCTGGVFLVFIGPVFQFLTNSLQVSMRVQIARVNVFKIAFIKPGVPSGLNFLAVNVFCGLVNLLIGWPVPPVINLVGPDIGNGFQGPIGHIL